MLLLLLGCAVAAGAVEHHPRRRSSIVDCHIVNGDVAPGSCLKRGGEMGVMLLTSTLSIVHPLFIAMATWPLLLM